MGTTVRVALVGDYSETVLAHQAIPLALELAATENHVGVEGVWTHTTSIANPATDFRDFDGLWCVPASPYADMEAALNAIRYAREQGVPFLGTCGGFQHALVEYARNVCGLCEAEHTEIVPNALVPLVIRICPLIEQECEIILSEGGLLRKLYGQDRITGGYHCSYGLNRQYVPVLFGNGLHPTAYDSEQEVRAVELAHHPFFVATLFQPERRALAGVTPPIVRGFVAAMREQRHQMRNPPPVSRRWA